MKLTTCQDKEPDGVRVHIPFTGFLQKPPLQGFRGHESMASRVFIETPFEGQAKIPNYNVCRADEGCAIIRTVLVFFYIGLRDSGKNHGVHNRPGHIGFLGFREVVNL